MMDISIISNPIPVASPQGLGFANPLLDRQNFLSSSVLALSDVYANHSAGAVQISAALFHATRRPQVRSHKIFRRTLLDVVDSGGIGRVYGLSGGDNEGPVGGSGGGGMSGGSRRFLNGYGGQDGDDEKPPSGFVGFVSDIFRWIAFCSIVLYPFRKAASKKKSG